MQLWTLRQAFGGGVQGRVWAMAKGVVSLGGNTYSKAMKQCKTN